MQTVSRKHTSAFNSIIENPPVFNDDKSQQDLPPAQGEWDTSKLRRYYYPTTKAMDGHLKPPSPALSSEELGIHHLIGHNAVTSLPGTGPVTSKAACAILQSHTPAGPSPANHGIGDFRSTTPAYSLRAEGAHMVSIVSKS